MSNFKRYSLFPILDEKAYEFYQKQEISHWSESELDFVADLKDYRSVNPQIKHMLDTILAFFLSGDGVISENITYRFLTECKTYEEKAMFISQLHIELIHAATYGMAVFTFKRDLEETSKLIETAQDTDCIKAKMNFMEKWMLSDLPKYQRLVAFGCAEGIFFCTLFAVIFWFRSKGLFPNFILANELIAKDESLHRDWSVYLFSLENSNNEIKVKEIIKEALEVEFKFVDYILPEPIEDLNKDKLKIYAKLIADNLIQQLGYETIYNVKNPFTWLDDISMEQKSNFFEVRSGAYSKKSLTDVMNWKKRTGIEENNDKKLFNNPEDIDF